LNQDKDQRQAAPPGLAAVENAIGFGGALYGNASVDEFNAAFDHVVSMLEDATFLFTRGSFNTSAFLAITAIEETAKAQIGIYRRDRSDGLPKGRDPLRDHKQKHRMAVLPTVFMGERLAKVLGADACARLQHEAETDGFTATREASLYCARVDGNFVTPQAAIEPIRAWELLLLAIETLDDNLVGYSNHTMEASARIDELFEKIAGVKP
jgi:AbiV family abortive infection protein